MNQFFNNKKLIILLISVITFISLIAYSLTNNREDTSVPQQVGNDVTGSIARIFSKPAEVVANFVDSVDNLMNTYEENQSLKSKIDTVYELQVQVYNLEQENARMQEELELKNTLSEYEQINASVVSRNPDSWLNQIVIDKGSNDGVEVDMSVMAGNGLIGRVSEVNSTSAKVLLLTTSNDTTNRVSAEIQTESGPVHGIVNGYDENTKRLSMSQIAPDAVINPGDSVATSGLGGVSPSSLLIGTVKEVSMDSYGLFKQVTIEPAGEVYNIRFVTVIKRLSGSGE
nr:rod shape-determining protein MreC [uncultured Trichococcus sp.]